MLTVDFHSHSTQSFHGLNTLDELLRQAEQNKMAAITITDHCPGINNIFWLLEQNQEKQNWQYLIKGPDIGYFNCLLNRYKKPEELKVTLFKGIECNLIDSQDNACDVPWELAGSFDIIIVSLHPLPHLFPIKNQRQITDGFARVLDYPIDILGHSYHKGQTPDYEIIVPKASNKGIALELNNSSFAQGRADMQEALQMLQLAKIHQCGISLASDAHMTNELGQDEFLQDILREIDFPQELIVNRTLTSAREFVTKRKKQRKQLVFDHSNP